MGPVGTAFELRVELHAHKPRVDGIFYDLHQMAIGGDAGGQAFVKTAPVSLVLISDLSRFGDAKSARSQLMGAMDSGIVSQNISIFCSAANIATVPRASMDNEQLKKVLKLKDSQMPMMNHPVGYFK